MKELKILIMGLGALGTVYSCLLKENGHKVLGLVRESLVSVVQEQGVKVTGIWGDHHAKLDNVVAGAGILRDTDIDMIIITVKSFDTEQVIRQIKHLVSPSTYVVLLQNGYGNYEAAVKHVPPAQLILGRVIFGAETLAPGASKVTVIADDVIIGAPNNQIDFKILAHLAGVFAEAGIPTKASAEIMKNLWGKIIYNSALNPLGAIFKVNYGKLAEVKESRLLLEKIIREIFELLAVSEQETFWPDADAYLKDFFEKLIPTTAAHHASMLQDIQNGKRTEIDALNGAIVRLGREYGVKVPVNEMVTLMIKAKEKFNYTDQSLKK
ncbi:MAG: 2-dehydropantoate 2-reductase [Thermincola sp.]|nr:2-dehydropantoate 2-reductase [Thermincola sp.]